MLNVVKIGGGVIDDEAALSTFLADFAAMPGPKILIHGGGRAATSLSRRLDIPTTMIEGRRVTDRDTLDVVTMVYAGLINKNIVARLQALGCNAIGLTGADAGAVRAVRRPAKPIDYGFVGDMPDDAVDSDLLATLLGRGITPVFCAIMHDGEGSLLNCNADTVGSTIATAMAANMPTRLTFCFEQPGVLADINDPASVVPLITPDTYTSLKADGTVSGGMIPKIDNALAAVSKGVEAVVIKHASNLNRPLGTQIRLNSNDPR